MALSTLPLSAFTGLSAVTGRALSGEAHLTQSLRDIITTPIGSRVMNRAYGSRVPFLLGQPMNRALIADVVAAVAEAVATWEPRVKLQRVLVRDMGPGRLALDLIDRAGRRLVLGEVTA